MVNSMNERINNDNVTNNNNDYVPRMRTIPRAYQELLKLDPDTSISMRMFRKICGSEQVPKVNIGNKTLINFDLLLDVIPCYNGFATGA